MGASTLGLGGPVRCSLSDRFLGLRGFGARRLDGNGKEHHKGHGYHGQQGNREEDLTGHSPLDGQAAVLVPFFRKKIENARNLAVQNGVLNLPRYGTMWVQGTLGVP